MADSRGVTFPGESLVPWERFQFVTHSGSSELDTLYQEYGGRCLFSMVSKEGNMVQRCRNFVKCHRHERTPNGEGAVFLSWEKLLQIRKTANEQRLNRLNSLVSDDRTQDFVQEYKEEASSPAGVKQGPESRTAILNYDGEDSFTDDAEEARDLAELNKLRLERLEKLNRYLPGANTPPVTSFAVVPPSDE